MQYFSRPGIEFKTVGSRFSSNSGKTDMELTYIITKSVVEITEVSLSDIKSSMRNKEIRQARQFVHYFLKKFTKLSSPGIGKVTINDHATVLHSIKVVTNDIHRDSELKEKYYEILELIKGYINK